LAKHRGQHPLIDHHAKSEPTGEAHPDRPDTRATTLTVLEGRQRSEPIGYR
jgi:hypothetical protein